MEPRDLVRVSILVCFGALAIALAAWLLSFGFSPAAGSGSPLAPLVVLGGLVLLGGALLLLGGAGADAVWSRLRRQP